MLPEPLGGMLGWLLGLTSFLLSRGRGLCGSEHPAERAPTQGKVQAGLPVRGETEAHGTRWVRPVGTGLTAGLGRGRLPGCASRLQFPVEAEPGVTGGRA